LLTHSSTLLITGALLFAGPAMQAQYTGVGTTPQVGTSQPASAEPPVPRPSTTPCTVTLFTDQAFDTYGNQNFSYTPACTGPYSKIVFTADFNVTSGRQYDRTAEFYINGVNIFFGTTPEPRSSLSPSWHVERDITDLQSTLATAQSGIATLYNIYNSTYNGSITGSARILFYPADAGNPAPLSVPDEVVPLSANGEDQYLNTGADQLAQTVALPTNVERAYLDVIAQSQQQDEFWYTNVPSDVSDELGEAGNTAFREVEVSIDGTPAGVAPVYPWIFTGGIDPYLWEPTVGVQTLVFTPFRVDLTPFAATLSDGTPHKVAVSVFNANNYFDVTAALLIYLDHGSTQVTGAITTNTLASAPSPYVYQDLHTDDLGDVSGAVGVASLRTYSISGYVNTSHGKIETTVNSTVDFGNYQTFDISASDYVQTVYQLSGALQSTLTTDGALTLEKDQTWAYPLYVTYNYNTAAAPSYTQDTSVYQRRTYSDVDKLLGFTFYNLATNEVVNTSDNLSVGDSVTHTGASTAHFDGTESTGHCWDRTITSSNSVVTGYTDGASCPGGNH
jgi:hypothetical protein